MADTSPAQASTIVTRIEMLCDFMENPVILKAVQDAIPHTGITHAPGALGFDIPQWAGLGIVGIWAALDAHADRADLPRVKCPTCERTSCISKRFENYTSNAESESIAELEDIRHLYAHNFGGDADAEYFRRKRHFLSSGAQRQMTCGVQFNGRQLPLDMNCLRFYSEKAQKVLKAFVTKQWVVRLQGHEWVVHQWEDWMPKWWTKYNNYWLAYGTALRLNADHVRGEDYYAEIRSAYLMEDQNK
jgi:hypothetical protein